MMFLFRTQKFVVEVAVDALQHVHFTCVFVESLASSFYFIFNLELLHRS